MDVAVSFSEVITAAKRYVSWRPLMRLFLRILLLHATCRRNAYSYLDQLCDVGNPQFRMTLLQDAMGRLDGKYDVTNGLAAFGVCDPTDPNINPDCLNYNNPSVAYGSTLVPCPDEKCPLETPESFVRGKSGFYQPHQDNALVLFGCMPPETEYFGIRTYLYEKAGSNVQVDEDFCKDAMSSPTGQDIEVFPPDPTVPGSRVVVDIPWYDTRNHLSINAVSDPDSTTKFRSLFVHITTANKQVSEDIVRAFVESGVPVEAMNIDSIPNLPVFDLEGNSTVRDSFRTIYRLVLPESIVSSQNVNSNAEDIDSYISLQNMNILVRYLTPKFPVNKNGFLPRRPTKKTVGETETDLVGKYTFQMLLWAVKSYYGEPDYVANPVPLVINMTKCLQGCYGFGENRDTAYINTDKTIELAGASDFAVVCGANHLLLGYAVYTSVGIFNTSGLAVGVITDEMKLNSALHFAPHLPEVSNLYCVEIRSDCHDRPFCVQPIFNDVEAVLVQYRINLNPNTKTGPAVDELIWPIILGYRGPRVFQ